MEEDLLSDSKEKSSIFGAILISNYDRAGELSQLLNNNSVPNLMVPEGVCKNGWIRDLFVQIGDLVITRHADKESVERILQFLGLKDQYQIRESEIGEGGMIRISGNDVLVHEKFINDPLIQEIKNKGFNVVFVPMPSRWQ